MSKKLNPRNSLVYGSIRRLSTGLLNMMYTTSELSTVLKIDRRTILHRWIPAGLPYTKDARGRFWFNGRDVETWIDETRSATQSPKPQNVMRCYRCRKDVETTSQTAGETGRTKFVTAICPKCGSKMFRFTGGKPRSW